MLPTSAETSGLETLDEPLADDREETCIGELEDELPCDAAASDV